MRVISGIYKGRRFDVPHSFKARPTTDFAKENLFNVLCNYVDFEEGLSALDLFAGTGSISLELLSRGCSQVISVEKDTMHCSFIHKVMNEIKSSQWSTVNNDVFRYLSRCNLQFDIIFADPPYELKELATLPDVVFSKKLLKPEGFFILEHGKEYDFTQHAHFFQHRQYGSVNFSLFK